VVPKSDRRSLTNRRLDHAAIDPMRHYQRITDPDYGELRKGEVRLTLDPIGHDFLGSCAVASRNSLIHNVQLLLPNRGILTPKGCSRVYCQGVDAA
jgi:hypothetical protein